MSRPIRVLVLEDRATDAEVIIRELRRAGFDPQWKRVETEADYLAELDASPDLILADYTLPHFDGLQAVDLLRERGLDIPFILISGTVGEEVAVNAMNHGVSDYLLKDRIARLGPAVERALEEKRLRQDRQRVEEQVRESERLYHSLVETLPQNIFRKDRQGRFTFANAHFCRTLGRALAEILGKKDADFFPPELAAKYRADDLRVMETAQPFEEEEEHHDAQGNTIHVHVNKTPLLDAAGLAIGVQGMFMDITERKRALEVLEKRAAELERFHRLSVGRELQMIELKKEVNELAKLAGRPPPYDLSFLNTIPGPLN